MTDITTIPLKELLADREECIQSATVFARAIAQGLQVIDDIDTLKSLLDSAVIIAAIDEELTRRKEKQE